MVDIHTAFMLPATKICSTSKLPNFYLKHFPIKFNNNKSVSASTLRCLSMCVD